MSREEVLKILTELEEYHRDDAPSSWSDNEAEALLSIVKRVVELHKNRPYQEITSDQVIGELCSCCPDRWPCRTFRIVSEELSKLGEGK